MTKLLQTLKLLNDEGTLDLTSIGVMVILVKIALAQTLDWATASTLLLALLSYAHKRHLKHKADATQTEANGQLQDVIDKVNDLNKSFAAKALLR